MANIKSAKKQARKAVKRHAVNVERRSSVKTVVKRLLLAIEKGEDLKVVQGMFKAAESKIARSKRKIMHPKTAARRVSRLAKRVAVYANSANA